MIEMSFLGNTCCQSIALKEEWLRVIFSKGEHCRRLATNSTPCEHFSLNEEYY